MKQVGHETLNGNNPVELVAVREAETGPRTFRFIDLFAGIGGTRLGFEAVGGRCVFGSEWDRFARETYLANHGDADTLAGDVNKIDLTGVPRYDVLVAGFPCQPFSLAGVSKLTALGRRHGFANPEQGNLFFRACEFIDKHRPRAFLLENVKNLKGHDQGRTYRVIMDTLREKLGYFVPDPQIIDAALQVPQHRERIYIVGFRDQPDFERFDCPDISDLHPKLADILESEVDSKYTLSDKLWNYLQRYAEKHRAKGNGFGFGLADLDHVSRTLSARYHKDGSEILIPQKGRNPRRLTPSECRRLMGFPDGFLIDQVSDTQAYRQFGNSVVVPIVEYIARAMISALGLPDASEMDWKAWRPQWRRRKPQLETAGLVRSEAAS